MFGFKHRNVARALVLSAPLSVSFPRSPTSRRPRGARGLPHRRRPGPSSRARGHADGLQTVVVDAVRQKLDAARNGLSPDTGSNVYKFGEADIAALPLGEATPLNQVVLQAPGVVQDSYGQLHVRGDHANVQYRIDGVVIPEAISGFGQSLETRFADNIDVLTGALPAQYGYRTAAVVDIRTKAQAQGNGGSVGYTGGSNGHDEESGEIAGAHGRAQLLPDRLAAAGRHGHREPDRVAQRAARPDPAGQGLRHLVVRAGRRQPPELHVRRVQQPLPDSRRARPGAAVRADRRSRRGLGDAGRAPARAQQLRGAVLPGPVGDAADYQLS